MNFKGIIFDMDGTMIDNMMVHHRAWQKQLASLGLELTLEEVQEKIHGVNEEILKRLFGNRFSDMEIQQIAWNKEATYRTIFEPELKLLEGLPSFLEELKNAAIPLAIGTAAPKENAEFVLNQLQLWEYFQAIRHAGHVTKGKPDPQVFELAAAGLNLNVSDCIVFEDSPTGAEAAYRANCPLVVVTTTHQKEEFTHLPNVIGFIEDYTTMNLNLLKKVLA